ncbi:Fe-S cluster assembly protein HesB [Streptomyces sp. WZ.A104]|uniref:HhH-GPD-type base excision DNA repair protein n=1 Tax=Streptomyces durocortorensis TaxID=2811104 RepID=A0ABY9VWK8_9ACTN|nr:MULTISPECIES: HhH-GPD-type base excision DNA repair protein [Streptomyces]PCG86011.1 Fe-S cluster assembly protein HesB [Streptomyces sp. WZ.A104]WNF28093.1 HhH-GPD-type base excision DNA repair protein [Streptomyces durocortorensis]
MTTSDSGKDLGQGFGEDVALRIAQQPEADELLGRSPLAALVGMLLDQQVPMEWAFTGPYTLAGRMGSDDLDAGLIAAQDPEAFTALFTAKPALHRYPGSMAQRVQQLCQYLVAEYGGDASAVWRDVSSGSELLERLKALPGFGEQKARIFLALLGKQFGVRPPGWREAAGPYGEAGSRRSVADITGPESLAEVRAYKQEAKAAAKAAKTAKATKAAKKAPAAPAKAAKRASATKSAKKPPMP